MDDARLVGRRGRSAVQPLRRSTGSTVQPPNRNRLQPMNRSNRSTIPVRPFLLNRSTDATVQPFNRLHQQPARPDEDTGRTDRRRRRHRRRPGRVPSYSCPGHVPTSTVHRKRFFASNFVRGRSLEPRIKASHADTADSCCRAGRAPLPFALTLYILNR